MRLEIEPSRADFGCSKEQANLATLVGALALALAETTRQWIHRLTTGPSAPSADNTVLWTASFRELLSGVAGSPARKTPQSGNLLLFALVAGRRP